MHPAIVQATLIVLGAIVIVWLFFTPAAPLAVPLFWLLFAAFEFLEHIQRSYRRERGKHNDYEDDLRAKKRIQDEIARRREYAVSRGLMIHSHEGHEYFVLNHKPVWLSPLMVRHGR